MWTPPSNDPLNPDAIGALERDIRQVSAAIRWIAVAAIGFALACFYVLSASAAPAAHHRSICLNIGDTVTVRGRADAMVNAGTYFVPLEPICVHYPRRTDRFSTGNLTTIGSKLPPGIYVEVTGELQDRYPVYGIGITTAAVRNVDDEVKANIAEAKRRCEAWQAAHSSGLSARAHGARVIRSPQNEQSEDYIHRCSIWAVDKALPHESMTIRRAVP